MKKYCNPCICTLPGTPAIAVDMVTIDQIIEMSARYLQIPPIQIISHSRERKFVNARKMIMNILWKSKRFTLGAIGKAFGGRDHTTVIHNYRTFRDLYDTEDDFRDQYQGLLNYLRIQTNQNG